MAFIGWFLYYLFIVLSTFGNIFSNTIIIRNCFMFFSLFTALTVIIMSKFAKQELLKICCLLLLGAITTLCIQSESVLMLFVFCIAAKDIDLHTTFTRLLKILVCGTILIILMALTGVIENKAYHGTFIWDNRVYLGFKHPNHAGAIFLNIILLLIMLKHGELCKIDIAFVVLIEIINYLGPKSKTSLILGVVAVIVVVWINKFNNRLQKIIVSKIKYLPMILGIFSILLVYGFYSNKVLAIIFNTLFSTRVEQMSYYWNMYDVTLFGQVLENVSSSNANTLLQMRGLDNGYLYMMLGQGVVFTVLFVYLSIRSIRLFYIEKNYVCITLLSIVFLWGMMETTMFKIEMNCMLLLLSQGIYYKRNKKIKCQI